MPLKWDMQLEDRIVEFILLCHGLQVIRYLLCDIIHTCQVLEEGDNCSHILITLGNFGLNASSKCRQFSMKFRTGGLFGDFGLSGMFSSDYLLIICLADPVNGFFQFEGNMDCSVLKSAVLTHDHQVADVAHILFSCWGAYANRLTCGVFSF